MKTLYILKTYDLKGCVIDGMECVIDGMRRVIDGMECVIDDPSTAGKLATNPRRLLHTAGGMDAD